MPEEQGEEGEAMAVIFQLFLIGLWGALVVTHTRRLMQLAAIQVRNWKPQALRTNAHRLWWWLGRSEFWDAVCVDSGRCIQLTLMSLMLIWILAG